MIGSIAALCIVMNLIINTDQTNRNKDLQHSESSSSDSSPQSSEPSHTQSRLTHR